MAPLKAKRVFALFFRTKMWVVPRSLNFRLRPFLGAKSFFAVICKIERLLGGQNETEIRRTERFGTLGCGFGF